MKATPIDPDPRSYAQACVVEGATKLVFVSGQIPEDGAGQVPAAYADQSRLAWGNVEKRLLAAGMNFDNLVKVTVFLSDRKDRDEESRIRAEILGGRHPALTIIIAGIWDEAWLLEIEAVAAA